MRARQVLLILFLFVPFLPAHAAPVKTASFEVAGWIPYWRADLGIGDVLPHLGALTTVNPFEYTVDENGAVYDEADIRAGSWPAFIAAARKAKVRVIPTIMWNNGPAIQAVLSDPAKRAAHIRSILDIVEAGGFDGIDIDYEAKLAETNPAFTLFLQELYAAMGNRWVYCTVEPRTPPASVFAVVPAQLEYANDYDALNAYCDRVVIMAYDQSTIDLKLNAAAGAAPYVPVADPQWVEKVVDLAAQTIPKRKLIIGIPTYGYEYAVTPLLEGFRYDRQWAFNPQYALDLAMERGLTPARNRAGEMSFSYIATTSPLFTNTGVAAGPGFSANAVAFNIVWWSDAVAVQQKITLAKKLGVRGVSIFKLDGSQDPKLWDILLGY